MRKLLAMLFIFSSSVILAQEHDTGHSEHSSKKGHFTHGKNFVMFEYGYTHISEGIAHDDLFKKEGHWVSSFGLDYFRLLNEKWRLGVKLDYELGHYIIPHRDNLKRENVFIVIPTAAYSLLPGWAIYGGAGIEFEEHENLFVTRLGTEYAFNLGHGWEIPIGFFGDFKEGYNTYAFTAGIGKFF